MSEVIVVCAEGCCPGCQDCWGYSIGCHQTPCRCDLPCTCEFDPDGSRLTRTCERHDDTSDTRQSHRHYDPDDDPFAPDPDELHLPPCASCGATGACAYDDEGRPLIHATEETTDGE